MYRQVQAAAAEAKKLPSWLGIASPAQRKHYKRLLRRYLVSIFALETKLWQDLPDLEPFARQALIAKLTVDGFYPQLDIDTPLFDMPDDVSTHYEGWTSQGAVGDRQIKTVVSKERTTFSMLQLALHNLNPEAPWTRWRLNRARWLEPVWKERLSVSYLIKMIASLNVGGEYDKQIRKAFYPSPGSSFGLSQALVERGFKQRAEMQLYSAARQGLNDWRQRLFTFAMAARKAAFASGRAMAEEYARMSGYSGVRLLEVSESYQSYGPMMRGEGAIAVTAVSADATTQIEPGEVGTGVSVLVKYEMTR